MTFTYIKWKSLEEGQGLNQILQIAMQWEKIETQLAALLVEGEESESIHWER